MRPSVLWNIQAQARGRVACILYKTRGFLVVYMCFISRRPLTYRVIKVIQYRKGLYDFYYMLVTLTTGPYTWHSDTYTQQLAQYYYTYMHISPLSLTPCALTYVQSLRISEAVWGGLRVWVVVNNVGLWWWSGEQSCPLLMTTTMKSECIVCVCMYRGGEPSVKLETNRPGNEASLGRANDFASMSGFHIFPLFVKYLLYVVHNYVIFTNFKEVILGQVLQILVNGAHSTSTTPTPTHTHMQYWLSWSGHKQQPQWPVLSRTRAQYTHLTKLHL